MSELQYTPLEDIERYYAELRAGFATRKLRSIPYRKYQVLQLGYLLQDNADRFKEALAKDLGRPYIESDFLEIWSAIADIKDTYKNVEKWSAPEAVPFNVNFFAMKPKIRKEPKGAVLIISPFNYPIWLTLSPLAGALAAGNCALLKPSELIPATSALLAELVPKYLDGDLVKVVNGAVPETTKLLEFPWDHILFTGGGKVARIVSTAAAKHLTPVTLELGGKSPAIISPTCDLQTTARRLLWGKFVNGGQTCVAPDYVLVPRGFRDRLVAALKETYLEFYGKEDQAQDPKIAHIVSKAHHKRLTGILSNTKGTVVLGGLPSADSESNLFLAPTVVVDVTGEDSLMQDEIFGPILPIVDINDEGWVDEAVGFINARDHPLALYLFSTDDSEKEYIFDHTQSGSCVANETLIHLGVPGAPFGGIGPSGSGQHTGKFTFDMFTHMRTTVDNPSWVDKLLGSRYPPYSAAKDRKLAQIARYSLPSRPKGPPIVSEALTYSLFRSQKSWFPKRWVVALVLAVIGFVARRKISQE